MKTDSIENCAHYFEFVRTEVKNMVGSTGIGTTVDLSVCVKCGQTVRK